MQTFDSQTPNIKCVDLKYFESITFRCKPAHFIDSGSFKLSILTPHTVLASKILLCFTGNLQLTHQYGM